MDAMLHIGPRRIISTLAVAVALISIAPITAWAVDNLVPTSNLNAPCQNTSQNGPPPPTVCRTDNANVTWWLESSLDWTTSTSDTVMEQSVNDAMLSYFYTDLTTNYDASPIFSGGGETDVVFRSYAPAFPGTWLIGITWCDDAVNGTFYNCDQTYINFRNANQSYGPDALACHEIGHAFGLTHGQDAGPAISNTDPDNGCMVTPLDAAYDGPGIMSVLNINAHY